MEMKMIKSLTLVFLTCGLVIGATAQRRDVGTQSQDVRLSTEQPPVYITSVRSGKAKSLATGESEERVWLRLSNNTRWAIWYEASDTPKEYGDVAMNPYVVENAQGRKVETGGRCHDCSVISLASGKSVIFSVPDADVSNGRSIRINFSYDWEDRGADREALAANSWVRQSVYYQIPTLRTLDSLLPK
jgi:hypothetical protein